MRKERLCRRCGKRPAKYRAPDGSYRSDHTHDLCLQCFRSERSTQYAGKSVFFDRRVSRQHRDRRYKTD